MDTNDKLIFEKSSEQLSEVQADPNFLTIASDYLSININTTLARTNSGSIADANNNYRLAYFWPSTPATSITTIRIDGTNYIYGIDGVQVQAPTLISPTLARSSWKIGDILVNQRIEVILNPYTNRLDMGRYSYTAVNQGTKNHVVGIRIMHDTMIRANDGPDFVVAGSEAPLQFETAFTGANIPAYFNAYERFPEDLNTASLGILQSNFLTPTKVVFARYGTLAFNYWDVSLTNTLGRGIDNAFALYFGEYTLGPNVSFTATSLYGLAAAVSIPFEDNVTLTESAESCIIDTTATVDVEAASNIFAYKYSYNENDCNNESLVRGAVLGFTLVFGNYGPLDYIASTSENTVVDTLTIPDPMNLEVVSLSAPSNLILLDLTTGNEITEGTVLASGEHSIQVLELLPDGTFSGAFDIPANTVNCISMLLQIQF